MPTLYVSEHSGMRNMVGFAGPVPVWPALARHAIPFSATAAPYPAPFNALTTVIRMFTDTNCCVEIGGTSPLAVDGTSPGMTAGQTEYAGVSPGDTLSVVTRTST